MLVATVPPPPPSQQTLTISVANPRYLSLRGKTLVLITSGEHYGAVLNTDFDYVRYLDALKADGLNLTRLFAGTYREVAGSFNIQRNTLAPAPEKYAAPWPRAAGAKPAADGQPRFDLDRWNDAYFRRLKDFCRHAGRRGVMVEVVLFCPFYDEDLWAVNPMKEANNVNGVGKAPSNEVYTLKHRDLLAVHERVTRKIVTELNGFGNVYFEICNEPYFGGVTLDWQKRIGEVIVETERDLPRKHLVAQNIANGSARVDSPLPMVSVFNFHYANPPTAVAENRHLERPIAFDETGFKGTATQVYRTDAWEFMLAGGAVYSNLDYSFNVDHPDGTAPVKQPTPGSGGPELRRQLGYLKRFMERLPLDRVAPDPDSIAGGVPAGAVAYALSEPGRVYAIYVRGGTRAALELRLPAGRWRTEWSDPATGRVTESSTFEHAGGVARITSTPYQVDAALRVERVR